MLNFSAQKNVDKIHFVKYFSKTRCCTSWTALMDFRLGLDSFVFFSCSHRPIVTIFFSASRSFLGGLVATIFSRLFTAKPQFSRLRGGGVLAKFSRLAAS